MKAQAVLLEVVGALGVAGGLAVRLHGRERGAISTARMAMTTSSSISVKLDFAGRSLDLDMDEPFAKTPENESRPTLRDPNVLLRRWGLFTFPTAFGRSARIFQVHSSLIKPLVYRNSPDCPAFTPLHEMGAPRLSTSSEFFANSLDVPVPAPSCVRVEFSFSSNPRSSPVSMKA